MRSGAVLEAPTLVAGLDDVAVVGETIKECSRLIEPIHTKQLSCVEAMTAYLDHIERLNPKVNAIVALEDRDRLILQATERDAQLAQGNSMGHCTGSRMR